MKPTGSIGPERLEKSVEIGTLWAFYGGLLTGRQQDALRLHYEEDLSLGEIGELQGVSRQAVCDNLARTEALLRRMEENIGCVKRDMQIRKAVRDILEAAAALDSLSDPAVTELAKRITAAAKTLEE